METESRTEGVADTLESQLERCDALLRDCDATIKRKGTWGDWELRNILSLTKACAQLGSVLARLEPKAAAPGKGNSAEEGVAKGLANGFGPPEANGHIPPLNGNGHAAPIHESSGSIPQ